MVVHDEVARSVVLLLHHNHLTGIDLKTPGNIPKITMNRIAACVKHCIAELLARKGVW